MKDNPMMQHYATVYASSMGVMLVIKVIRGIAFVKVRRSQVVLMRAIDYVCDGFRHTSIGLVLSCRGLYAPPLSSMTNYSIKFFVAR